jgi:histidinol-phosphate aminotransferase
MNPLPAHVASLRPYESARSLWKGDSWIFMDANESPVQAAVALEGFPPVHRYPDPTADALRDAVAVFYGLQRQNLFMANGSDELIDLLVRGFVRRGRKIVSLAPTYGMYRVSAEAAGADFVTVPLLAGFGIDADAVLAALNGADLLFLCSPNNPTGTVLEPALVERLAAAFPGVICVDEAYGEFADAQGIGSSIELVRRGVPNLIALRTFSKAFAAAGIRLGYGAASPAVIDVLLRIKPPYNVNVLSQAAGLALWSRRPAMEENVRGLIAERDRLMGECRRLGCAVFPSVANFFLLEPPDRAADRRLSLRESSAAFAERKATLDAPFAERKATLAETAAPQTAADRIYHRLLEEHRLVVRRFAGRPGLENVLRISVGTPEQNAVFLAALSQLLP